MIFKRPETIDPVQIPGAMLMIARVGDFPNFQLLPSGLI